ncbi:MAG: PIN domain-containing protein [Thermoplasmatota archaeon]
MLLSFFLKNLKNTKMRLLINLNDQEKNFDRFMEILKRRISFYPYDDFKTFRDRAIKITPDPDDAEYVALALNIKAGIWSNDKVLKSIMGVDVYSTGDLIKILDDI